eukprot:2220449-Pleurochrysis_carterae.AAC.3
MPGATQTFGAPGRSSQGRTRLRPAKRSNRRRLTPAPAEGERMATRALETRRELRVVNAHADGRSHRSDVRRSG